MTYRGLAATLLRKRILVSLEEQKLYALQDGSARFTFPCVTGDDTHPTDRGTFPITSKDPTHVSRAYNVPMHYAMFFTKDGKAVHQYHGALGLTAVRALRTGVSDWFGSHGCVRLEKENANALFHWTPLHTEVHVF